jgi:putative transcriptional regulator
MVAALAAAVLAVPAARSGESLAGKLLIATPALDDPYFAQTVIFMVEADELGAMGLVVNRTVGEATVGDLLAAAGIKDAAGDRTIEVHYGGPVEPRLGFTLHGSDYADPTTRAIGADFALSPGTEVLSAIGGGGGPARFVFALGYAGWGPGQLESEIRSGSWYVAPADPDLVFADDPATIWRDALDSRYIEL